MTNRATMTFLFVAFFIITALLCWVASERGFKRGAKYGENILVLGTGGQG